MAKVVRFHEFGGPAVLRLEEITFEDPAPGELRLKAGAIGLNRLEVVYRSGGFGAPNKYPAALGSECAGTVEVIGKGVTGFKIGDRVATIPGFTTLPGFLKGMEFRAETVYSPTASANTGILEARLWLGDRDRALLAIASFIIHRLD